MIEFNSSRLIIQQCSFDCSTECQEKEKRKAFANRRQNNNRNYSLDPSKNCLRPEHYPALCKRTYKERNQTSSHCFVYLSVTIKVKVTKEFLLFLFFFSLMEKVFTFSANFLFHLFQQEKSTILLLARVKHCIKLYL